MSIIDFINENRLAATSLILGILAIVILYLMHGVVNGFLFLGIPAIVTGAASLMRARNQRNNQSHLASLIIPVAGIILGLLSMLMTILAIY